LKFLFSLQVLAAVHFESALSIGMKDEVQVGDNETAYQTTSKVVYCVIYSFRGKEISGFRDRVASTVHLETGPPVRYI